MKHFEIVYILKIFYKFRKEEKGPIILQFKDEFLFQRVQINIKVLKGLTVFLMNFNHLFYHFNFFVVNIFQ